MSTVQRFRFIAVAMLAVVALMVILNIGNVYAQTTTVNCSPSTIDVGESSSCTATVTGASLPISGETITWSLVTGTITFPSGSTCNLSGTSCSITVTGATTGSVTLQANYPGDSDNDPASGTFSVTVNSAPPIPEYPYGLSLLAIFMVIGYGVMRRRTITKQKGNVKMSSPNQISMFRIGL